MPEEKTFEEDLKEAINHKNELHQTMMRAAEPHGNVLSSCLTVFIVMLMLTLQFANAGMLVYLCLR